MPLVSISLARSWRWHRPKVLHLLPYVAGVFALSGFPLLAQATPEDSPLATRSPFQSSGSIIGKLVDTTGAPIPLATIRYSADNQSYDSSAVSDEDGQFRFSPIPPGPYHLAISCDGFAQRTYSGSLRPGEAAAIPALTLTLSAASTQVQVTLTREQLAEADVKDEEKQRAFGLLPNFYVTYDSAAVPLRARQKFELAWKSTIDPFNFGLIALVSGIQQANHSYPEYGQGIKGYAKRYGASYLDLAAGNFVGSALLPTLLRQDPRYFYKGRGSVRSRILYAVATSVMCKGDNGRWQANYSGVAGGLAAWEISRLYRPASARGTAGLGENIFTIIASTAVDNLLQEFLIRKLTPHAPNYAPAKPDN